MSCPASRVLLLLLLLGVAAPAALAAAQGDAWGYDLADELMSPFCPGRALSECPSPQAEELREWILGQERSGASRAEVEAELFRVYGDQLRQTPRAEGVGLVAYGMPALVFVLGGVLVALLLRGRRGAELAPAGAPAPDPELERLLDAEFRREEEER